MFGIPTILNFIAFRIAIPFLNAQKIFPIEVAYFLSVGLLVLVPMFFGAIFLTSRELKSKHIKEIFERMRIKKLSKMDILWTVLGFIFLSFASFLIAKIILPIFQIDANPFFFKTCPSVTKTSGSFIFGRYSFSLIFLGKNSSGEGISSPDRSC